MTFANKLKALRNKATPGPWVSRPEFGARDSEDWEVAPAGHVTSYSAPSELARFWNYEGKNKHNADLITYLVNHAEELEALVRAVDEWKSWLDRTVSHRWCCGLPSSFLPIEGKLIAACAALNKEGDNESARIKQTHVMVPVEKLIAWNEALSESCHSSVDHLRDMLRAAKEGKK
jgi:hypothetical protein